jgi:hypothetical protein
VEEVAFTWRSDADGAAHWLSPREKETRSECGRSKSVFVSSRSVAERGQGRESVGTVIAKTLISVHMPGLSFSKIY